MSNSAITVREVFDVPEPGSPAESSPRWQTFQQWMGEEVKGIKSAAMPDVAAKIAELLEIPIPGIFLTSWKKSDAIRELLDESRKTPEAIMHLELAEHTINSQHKPHIEIRIKNTCVKKIEFTLKLLFKLKGFILRIQNGVIREMQAGTCEIKGTLEYQGLAIVEKKLAPINLPATIPLEVLMKTEDRKVPDQVLSGGSISEKSALLEPTTKSLPVEKPQGDPVLSVPRSGQGETPLNSELSAPTLTPPVKVATRPSESVSQSEIVETDFEPHDAKEEEREQFVL